MYRRALSVSALAALVLGVGGGLSSAWAGKRATTASKAPYNLAAVAALTGAASVNGIAGVAGAQAAIDYINSTGGVNHHKLKLTVLNDQSSVTVSPAVAQQAVSLHPAGILDITASTYFTARQPVYVNAGVPVITNTSTDLTFPWMYTTYPTAYQEGLTFVTGVMSALGVKDLKGKTVVYVAADTTGDHAQYPIIVQGIQAKGGSIVDTEFQPLGSPTFNGAPNVVSKNPSIVMIGDSGPDNIVEVNALRHSGYNGPIYTNYGGSATNVATTLNSPTFSQQWLAPEELPTKSIAWKWAVKTGQTSQVGNVNYSMYWSSTILYAQGLQRCGFPCSAAKLEKNLKKIGRIGIPGNTVFGLWGVKGNDHVLMTAYVLATYKNGNFVLSKPVKLGSPHYGS